MGAEDRFHFVQEVKSKQPSGLKSNEILISEVVFLWKVRNRWMFVFPVTVTDVAAVSGINGSSSSVNMNPLWHLVRSFLPSGDGRNGTRERSDRLPGAWWWKKNYTNRDTHTHIYTRTRVYSHKSQIHWRRNRLLNWTQTLSFTRVHSSAAWLNKYLSFLQCCTRLLGKIHNSVWHQWDTEQRYWRISLKQLIQLGCCHQRPMLLLISPQL